MKILYISPVFEVSTDPGSDRYHFYLKRLVEAGHEVTVITSAVAYKLAQVRPECRGRWKTEVVQDGIRVLYLWSYPNLRGSFLRRMLYLISYMLLAVWSGLWLGRPDVIYTPNSPGMVGYAGYLLSRLRRVPLVFEVADVWPDAAIAMGMLTNPLVISLTRWMEDACYRQAKFITALTRGIKANIEKKGYPPEKIILATNGVDPGIFADIDCQRVAQLRADLGLEGCFIGSYLGAHGHYNSLWTIVEAAALLRDDPRFRFVLIGDGDYKATLQEMVREAGLSNVLFLPPIPRHESPVYLAIADVYLLPNRKGEFYQMNLPNKLFDFLASGRPVLVAGEGESGNAVLAACAGMVTPAEDAAEMAAALKRLADMSSAERRAMGEGGRAYAFKHYNRQILSQQIEAILVAAATSKPIG